VGKKGLEEGGREGGKEGGVNRSKLQWREGGKEGGVNRSKLQWREGGREGMKDDVPRKATVFRRCPGCFWRVAQRRPI